MLLKFPRLSEMRGIMLLIFLFVAAGSSSGQNLIGYNKTEIRKFMKENRKDMNFNTVRNSLFSYLKYTDNAETQTILFFLAPDSVCSGVRVVFASGLKKEKIAELDSSCKKIAPGSWIDTRDGKNFIVKLKEEKWSCTITYESEK